MLVSCIVTTYTVFKKKKKDRHRNVGRKPAKPEGQEELLYYLIESTS